MKKVLLTWVAGMLALTGHAQHAYLCRICHLMSAIFFLFYN